MAVVTTPNRGYPFPETDINLESSNGYLRSTIFTIDTDIQALFNNKANKGESYTTAQTDQLFADFDKYGEYTTGDVRGKNELNLKTDTFANPGFYSKIEVNDKGLVIGYAQLTKADVSDFTEGNYAHLSGDETIDGLKTFPKLVTLQGGIVGYETSIFNDAATSDLSKTWTSAKLISKFSDYVLTTDFTDADILAKIKNVDGVGSGLEAESLNGQAAAWYLDFPNFTSLPTTIGGYGITNASVKATLEANADTNTLTDDAAARVSKLPVDTAQEILDINTLLTSDDATLDELQEVVNYIKVNRTNLDALTLDNIAETATNKWFTAIEKTKLGLIEDNATADQTKADIDALLIDAATVNSLTVETAVPASAIFTDTVYDDTTIQGEVDLNTAKRSYPLADETKLGLIGVNGDTASRPASPAIAQQYYDTTLGLPIWFNGTDWTNAAGTVV